MCVEWERRGPFYSLERSVPAIPSYGNVPNRLQEDKIELPVKMHWTGACPGLAEPMVRPAPTLVPLATAFLWVTAWWVLVSGCRCRGLVDGFGLSSGPLLVVLRRTRSSATSSSYASCFLLIPDLCS